ILTFLTPRGRKCDSDIVGGRTRGTNPGCAHNRNAWLRAEWPRCSELLSAEWPPRPSSHRASGPSHQTSLPRSSSTCCAPYRSAPPQISYPLYLAQDRPAHLAYARDLYPSGISILVFGI
ncbi:hypothetical protein P692DRAFT_20886836, partial [Suillus brevipes Sb2]